MDEPRREDSIMETSESPATSGENAVFRALDIEKDHVSVLFYVVAYFFLALPLVAILWYLLQLQLQFSMLLASLICGALLAVCTLGIIRFVKSSYNKRYGFAMHATADRLIMLRGSKRREYPFSGIFSLQFIRAKQDDNNLTRVGLAEGRRLVFKGNPMAPKAFKSLSEILRASTAEHLEKDLARGRRLHFQEPIVARITFLIMGLGFLIFGIAHSILVAYSYLIADESPGGVPPVHISIGTTVTGVGSLGHFWKMQRGGLFMDQRGIYRVGLFHREEIPWEDISGVIQLNKGLAIRDTRGRERLRLSDQARNAFCLEALIERVLRSR